MAVISEKLIQESIIVIIRRLDGVSFNEGMGF
jgi:hypothetical protein